MTAPAVPPSPSPLVGRDRELTTLRAALDAALAGRGSLVLIGGEAGIGKTTLAEAICAEATARGALVLVGRCYDLSETPPYGPWAEALTHAPGNGDLPTLPAAVLPPERGGATVDSQDAIMRRVRDYLAALATRQPVALLLEDLHWADPASLDLLRVVGRGLADLPLLILTTYRDDEIADESSLATTLPALVREARAARLTPTRLDDAATRALAQARYRLSAADEARLVRYLHAHAEGNPLFLGELLRALEEVGTLRPTHDSGAWALGDLAVVRVPSLLRQVIGARVARLGADTGRLLAVAAVVGQEVPLDLWGTVSEADDDTLAKTVGSAIAARVLAETPDGQGVRFAHALVREALYEATPLPRRRTLHRRVAEALLATPHPDPDAVAGHLQRAGDPRAVEWLTEAGHRALRAVASRTAAARFGAALALLGDGGSPAERGWLLFNLAGARYFIDPHGGIGHLREVLRLADMAHDRALAAYARYQLGFHLTGVGDLRRGLPEMVAGVAAIEALAPDERRLAQGFGIQGEVTISTLALRLAHLGRFEEARTLALRARAPGSVNNADVALAEVQAALGHVDEALASRERAYAMLGQAGQWLNVGILKWYGLQRLVIPFQADLLEKRRQLAAEATAAFARSGGAQGDEIPRLGYLPLLVLEGEWAEARTIALAVEAGSRAYRPGAVSVLADLAFAQGDRILLAALVRKALPEGPSEEPGGVFLLTGLRLQRLAALQAIADGDLATARDWLDARDHWVAWSGVVLGRAEGRIAWATYERAAGDLTAAREHAEAALAHATEPHQPLALLAAHRALGELHTAAGQHTEAHHHLDAALALADACAAPYERALTLLALAELHLAKGARETTRWALSEARATLTGLQARPALARCDALAVRLRDETAAPPGASAAAPLAAAPAGLTAREVEVLRLVAAGRSNREMAELLSRSERTIERHLENIYRKIDARNRADATAFALRHHLA